MVKKRIAEIISVLFHPLFMPLYAVLVLFQTSSRLGIMHSALKNYIYGIFTISLIIIPLLMVLAFQSIRWVESLQMNDKRERFLPLIIISLSAISAYYLFHRSGIVPKIIMYFIVAIIINSLLTSLITLFWKISTHMIGAGGVAAYIVFTALVYWIDIELIIVVLVFIIAAIAFARLYLQKHSPTEVYLGFIQGFSITTAILFYLVFN